MTYQCCRSRQRRGRAVVAGVPPWGGAHLDCRRASCAPCTSAQAHLAIDPWINQTSATTCHCLTCLGLLLATTCFCHSHNVIVSKRFVRQAVCTPRVTNTRFLLNVYVSWQDKQSQIVLEKLIILFTSLSSMYLILK